MAAMAAMAMAVAAMVVQVISGPPVGLCASANRRWSGAADILLAYPPDRTFAAGVPVPAALSVSNGYRDVLSAMGRLQSRAVTAGTI
jgi:hypothetical protein